MPLTSSSSGNESIPVIVATPAKPLSLDAHSIAKALQSGDLNEAHRALAALQKDNQAIQNARWVYRIDAKTDAEKN